MQNLLYIYTSALNIFGTIVDCELCGISSEFVKARYDFNILATNIKSNIYPHFL